MKTIIFMIAMLLSAQDKSETISISLVPAEVQILAEMFRSTTIQGNDAEVFAPMGAKLNQLITASRKVLADTTMQSKVVELKVTENERVLFLKIVNGGKILAGNAGVVVNLKDKLQPRRSSK